MDFSSGGKRLSGFLKWWLLAEWIIKEVVNRTLDKKRLLEAFDNLMHDQNFRDQQILEVKKYILEKVA